MIRATAFRFNGCIGVGIALCLTALGATLGYAQASQQVAIEHRGPAGIRWDVQVPFESLLLVVVGRQGEVFREEFDSSPWFSLADQEGNLLPDGRYKYELRVTPHIDPEVRRKLEAVRDSGDDAALRQMMLRFGIPTKGMSFTGSFSIAGGNLVTRQVPENGFKLASDLSTVQEPIPPADQVIPDDLIVQASACVGLDCVNGESFGFDTIRLKENNLRIKFEDTSTTAGFPSNDWQLTANDSASGGANKFSIEDITGGKVPLTVEAGAPNNSLYVDDGGRVGFGTSTPVLDQHSVSGNTPALRLEQDGSGGFTPQTWDIASNEANFFIRDVTGGSRLPFRIQPGAPSNSLYIASDGDVGLGTQSPTAGARLHVVASTGAGAVDSILLENNAPARIKLKNTAITPTATTDPQWVLNSNGTFRISAGLDAAEMTLDASGAMTILGTLTENSSVHAKQSFAPVDPREVLRRVAELPVTTWSYKSGDPSVRHMGPMAQDFFAAFGLGPNDEGIAPRDLSAVALAAVQGLHQELKAKNQQILDLEERLAALEALLAKR